MYAFLGGVIDVETFLAPALTNPFYALLSENGIVRRRPKKRKNDVEEVCDDNKVEEESKEAMSMNFLHPESVLKSLAEESFEGQYRALKNERESHSKCQELMSISSNL